jgi:hypothetical protein
VILLSYDVDNRGDIARNYLQTKYKPGQGKTLTHGNPITQRECNPLCFAPDSDMPHNGAGFRSLDAEIGKRILTCTTAYARVHTSTSIPGMCTED